MFRKQEVRVTGCHTCDSGYVFTLSGQVEPGRLFELYDVEGGPDALMAIIEVERWGVDNSIIAYTIWFDWVLCKVLPCDLLVYPNVVVAPIHRRSIERYLTDEGKQGITRVLYADPHTYVVHRLGYKVIKNRDPWLCYLLDGVTDEYSVIANKTTLEEMKHFLIDLIPTKRSEIAEWGTEGCQVFNLLDYGAFGDGVHDDTAAVLRVFGIARRGDVIYIPVDCKIKIQPNITMPKGVVVDIRLEQIVILDNKKD